MACIEVPKNRKKINELLDIFLKWYNFSGGTEDMGNIMVEDIKEFIDGATMSGNQTTLFLKDL